MAGGVARHVSMLARSPEKVGDGCGVVLFPRTGAFPGSPVRGEHSYIDPRFADVIEQV